MLSKLLSLQVMNLLALDGRQLQHRATEFEMAYRVNAEDCRCQEML